MTDIDPERAEMVRRKYIDLEPTLENAAITAEAEQHERAIREARAAVEQYNEANGLEWINWELPTELRDRVYKARARLREAQARDSRHGEGIVHYYDDRNKHDEANGWPAYEYWNPHHQTVPLGTVVAKPEKVYVLRGGTAGGVLPRERRAPELDMVKSRGVVYDVFV
ncbi:hypothetical protein [Mycolicibacterium tusciae]|uniref:hypothetical protein n=1 Tax=Mycolicibacterium tusciae TaxID=75922 RepID=UPI00024A174B|nr:hypothetical protein [Mycolicibacterium tusciae]